MKNKERTRLCAAGLLMVWTCYAHSAQSGSDAQVAPSACATPTVVTARPFPADARASMSSRVAGTQLRYMVTVGALAVRDECQSVIGQVVFTSYVVERPLGASKRPVSFVFNGGPGAASVLLNFGALGPKHLQFGIAGNSASDPPTLQDNEDSWLDFTDLVFIDPVGTGFSRSWLPETETNKRFFATQPDIEYLSRIIYDWLLNNGRMESPKYIVGESYGGFRGPRLAHYLQTSLGVGINGLVLLSPYLTAESSGGVFSPLGWVTTLPSLAAAAYEKAGKTLSRELLAEVEHYAQNDYLVDLLKGNKDKGALERISQRVANYTGLDPEVVRSAGGRIEISDFSRRFYSPDHRIASLADPNVTAYDPFPWAPEQRSGDPMLDSVPAPATSAMVDFVTRVVGWKVDARYYALNMSISEKWAGGIMNIESVTDLRQVLALDPRVRVLIAHGYSDLICPYFASALILDQIPSMGEPARIEVKTYPGGHMFYARSASRASFRQDALKLYGVGTGLQVSL
jgi:carboxypeptidase C (cathepsin A)